MPTLQQLRYLVAVSETLHFRRAAERTYVTQPTLSAQLRELEGKLGVQLVERSRARVVLTPVGAEIARRAKTVLRDVSEISALARQGHDPLAGTVRVGLVQSLGSYFLPLVIPDLHAAFPNLKFYVREGTATDLVERLEDGTLDLLFFPLPLSLSDLCVRPLFREPLLPVMPISHPLAIKREISRTDLRGETVMTLEPGHRLQGQVAEICADTGAELSLDYAGTSLDTLRQMVATELGISFLPALYVRSEVAREALVVARPLEAPQPSRDIGMVWRMTSARGAAFETIADLLRDTLAANAPEVQIIDAQT